MSYNVRKRSLAKHHEKNHSYHRGQPRHRSGHSPAGGRSRIYGLHQLPKSCSNYEKPQAEQLVDEITSQGGIAHAFAGDVGRESDVIALFEAIDTAVGPITALVNNAGILERNARLDEMTLDRWQRVFDVNVFGSFLCAKEAVKRMSTRYGGAGGAIVNISSISARLGAANQKVDYAAAKGAVDAMTIGLAKEVAAEGIRVNCVRPGLIYTDIHAGSGEPGRVDRLARNVPIQRGGQPEEIARLVLWLLSDEASYVTASIVEAGGGR